MYPYILPSIFGEHLSSYGLMFGIGVLVCIFVYHKYATYLKMDAKFIDFVEWIAIFAIIGGIISAILFQNLYDYIEDPTNFHFSMGLTFMGGLIGGVLTFLVCYFIKGRKYQTKLNDMLSIAACCIVVAHAFGRIGCFLAGCCYGKQTDSFLGIDFPYGSSIGKVLPVQLFESAFLFVLFGVLSFLTLKKKYKYGMETYMLCYGIWRFSIEYLRDDYRGTFVGNLTPSQFWSIVMFVGSIVLFIYRKFFMDKVFAKFGKKEIVSENTTDTQTDTSNLDK